MMPLGMSPFVCKTSTLYSIEDAIENWLCVSSGKSSSVPLCIHHVKSIQSTSMRDDWFSVCVVFKNIYSPRISEHKVIRLLGELNQAHKRIFYFCIAPILYGYFKLKLTIRYYHNNDSFCCSQPSTMKNIKWLWYQWSNDCIDRKK